ncbi:hypothetical protein [Terrisporobacter glycolicus]|uniref:hypothetical protein n=1 Tax=Terrisporobacter glycolicus TaxID=36841 RepID=UPI00346477CD
MWKKFKELRLVFKIIVGIIAFIFLPVTLLLFAIELFIRSIKNKNIAGGIIAGILSIILLFVSSAYVSGVVTTDTTQLALEQKEKEDAEQARIEQEAKEKEDAEQKAKEEEAKKKAEEEQKAKELEEQKKAEEEQKAKELAKKDDEQKTSEIKNTTNKNKTNYNSNNNSNKNDNNNSSAVVYWNGGSSKSNIYHATPKAHGMKGAVKMTEKQAKSRGYRACKRCY